MLKKIAEELVDDGIKIRFLILKKLWENLEFMDELHKRVKIVPMTKSYLLSVTYRNYAVEVVGELKLMVKQF